MDNFTIKLNATHSSLKIRLAEIRFDLRQTIRQVKVSKATIIIEIGNLGKEIRY